MKRRAFFSALVGAPAVAPAALAPEAPETVAVVERRIIECAECGSVLLRTFDPADVFRYPRAHEAWLHCPNVHCEQHGRAIADPHQSERRPLIAKPAGPALAFTGELLHNMRPGEAERLAYVEIDYARHAARCRRIQRVRRR